MKIKDFKAGETAFLVEDGEINVFALTEMISMEARKTVLHLSLNFGVLIWIKKSHLMT